MTMLNDLEAVGSIQPEKNMPTLRLSYFLRGGSVSGRHDAFSLSSIDRYLAKKTLDENIGK